MGQTAKKKVEVPVFVFECVILKNMGGSSTTAARARRTSTAATAALRTGDRPAIQRLFAVVFPDNSVSSKSHGDFMKCMDV